MYWKYPSTSTELVGTLLLCVYNGSDANNSTPVHALDFEIWVKVSDLSS